MTLQVLKEKVRIAQITKDLRSYILAVEGYCKANDIDVWQITRQMMELIEKESTIIQLDTVLDLAKVPNIETLEIFITNAMSTGELLDEVTDIKDEVRDLYKKLIDLTSTLSQHQDT